MSIVTMMMTRKILLERIIMGKVKKKKRASEYATGALLSLHREDTRLGS
jgi:hypothetical protein